MACRLPSNWIDKLESWMEKPMPRKRATKKAKPRVDKKYQIKGVWDLFERTPWPFEETEYRFHPTRRWLFDWACVEKKVAIEVNGYGRHQTFIGYQKDREKVGEAMRCGWKVIEFTPQQISKNPVWCIDVIKSQLQGS